jgi:hypothetical protein
MRSISITKPRRGEVDRKDGRTVGRNSKLITEWWVMVGIWRLWFRKDNLFARYSRLIKCESLFDKSKVLLFAAMVENQIFHKKVVSFISSCQIRH